MTTIDTIKNVMGNLNIPQQQIEVYLKLLELGESGVTQLSKATNINRTTLYPIIQKMELSGLITKIINNRSFKANHPKQLFENLQRNNLALHQILPLFSQIMKSDIKPTKVKFYSGLKGTQQMLMDELSAFDKNPGKTLRVIGDSDSWYFYDKNFKKQYQTKRKELGVKVKIILTAKSAKWNEPFGKLNMHIKYLAQSYQFTGRVSFSHKKIALAALREKNGIIIQSPELAGTFIQCFDFMWAMLK